MSDIEKGDWVTIAGCGPYEVRNVGTFQGVPNRIFISDAGLWADPQWCVKVPPPFRPEPGTVWRDNQDNIWQCVRLTTEPALRRQFGTNAVRTVEYVQSTYGPLTQLVPKEATDE